MAVPLGLGFLARATAAGPPPAPRCPQAVLGRREEAPAALGPPGGTRPGRRRRDGVRDVLGWPQTTRLSCIPQQEVGLGHWLSDEQKRWRDRPSQPDKISGHLLKIQRSQQGHGPSSVPSSWSVE